MSARRLAIAALVALGSVAAACGPARAPSRPPAPPPPPAASGPPQPPAPAGTPATWAELGALRPLWTARNRPGPVSDPAHPRALAYCGPGWVRLSHDGGRAWSTLPTKGVVAATAGTAFPVQAPPGTPAPACTLALADAAHPQTAYATFDAGPAKYGMPPVYHIPLVTTDGGRRWRVVAPPAGFAAGGFGGFQAGGGEVEAVFGRSGARSGGTAGPSFGVVATADGGTTWRPGRLACPSSVPCLAWWPAASGTGSCAMHSYPQPVESSADGGRTWLALAIEPDGCSLNQLAGLPAARVALVANGGAGAGDALRISDDRGATWQAIALPPLPGGGAATRALQWLPSGALLAPVFARSSGGAFGFRLDLLRPGAASWCTVPGVTLAGTGTDPATLQAAGGRLWWVEAGARSAPVARSLALSLIRC